MRLLLLAIILLAMAPGLLVADERKPLFVDEVRFKDFPEETTTKMSSWGSALAAEIAGVLQGSKKYQPMTMENLEAQLGKERIKQTLACGDAACVNRIVENFGCSESVFATVRYIDKDSTQITLTFSEGDEKAAGIRPRYARPVFPELAENLQEMVTELFQSSSAQKEEPSATLSLSLGSGEKKESGAETERVAPGNDSNANPKNPCEVYLKCCIAMGQFNRDLSGWTDEAVRMHIDGCEQWAKPNSPYRDMARERACEHYLTISKNTVQTILTRYPDYPFPAECK